MIGRRTIIGLSLIGGILLSALACEREAVPSGSTSVLFNVSESLADLQTGGSGKDNADTITLRSKDGHSLRLVALETALPPKYVDAAPVKARKIYYDWAQEETSFAAWAYSLSSQDQDPSGWELDPGTGSTPVKVELDAETWLWKPREDVRYNINYPGYTQWFAFGPWEAYQGDEACVSGLTLEDGSAPTLSYTVPSGKNVDKHWDLLAARPEARLASEMEAVELAFGHVLTGIRFKRNHGLVFDNIRIDGVYDSATLELNHLSPYGDTYWNYNVDNEGSAEDLWSNRQKEGNIYEMDFSDMEWTEGTKFDTAGEDPDILMMIPQRTPQGARIVVTISEDIYEFGEYVYTDYREYVGDISGHRWVPGHLVTYYIDFRNTMQFTIEASTENGHTLDFPFVGEAPVTMHVDWGDGTDRTFQPGEEVSGTQHTYPSDGEYVVTITTYGENNYGSQVPSYWFQGNTMLKEINTPLLLDWPSRDSVDSMFRDCYNLTSVCGNLFMNFPKLRLFQYTFKNCRSLACLPEDLFAYSKKAITFWEAFSGCSGLTSLPSRLFEGNRQVTSFAYAFVDCTGLTSIPDNLFARNPEVDTFAYVFKGCSGLHSLPGNLFAGSPKATQFYYAFQDCTGLTTVPENLFANNPMAQIFHGTFMRCTSLRTIPERLFANNRLIDSFYFTFMECYSLEAIPENLFANNPEVLDFQWTFRDCRSLTSIPANLFKENRKVKDFTETFYNCTGLVNPIPPGLFSNNTMAERFTWTFYYCTNMPGPIPEDLFANIPNSSRLSFTGTFSNCWSLTGSAPKLWETHSLAGSKQNCFVHDELLDNYHEIPPTWGGGFIRP